jgi:hypothetical protein
MDMKLLVLTSEPISGRELGDALPDEVDPTDTEVLLVAPALQENPLKFWVSDADEAIDRAQRVKSASVQGLKADGIEAAGDTGEGDPVQAIEDALATFPAERIVVFTHEGNDAEYREDVDPDTVRERFGLPVDWARVSGATG